jgi:hypothetical protein
MFIIRASLNSDDAISSVVMETSNFPKIDISETKILGVSRIHYYNLFVKYDIL